MYERLLFQGDTNVHSFAGSAASTAIMTLQSTAVATLADPIIYQFTKSANVKTSLSTRPRLVASSRDAQFKLQCEFNNNAKFQRLLAGEEECIDRSRSFHEPYHHFPPSKPNLTHLTRNAVNISSYSRSNSTDSVKEGAAADISIAIGNVSYSETTQRLSGNVGIRSDYLRSCGSSVEVLIRYTVNHGATFEDLYAQLLFNSAGTGADVDVYGFSLKVPLALFAHDHSASVNSLAKISNMESVATVDSCLAFMLLVIVNGSEVIHIDDNKGEMYCCRAVRTKRI